MKAPNPQKYLVFIPSLHYSNLWSTVLSPFTVLTFACNLIAILMRCVRVEAIPNRRLLPIYPFRGLLHTGNKPFYLYALTPPLLEHILNISPSADPNKSLAESSYETYRGTGFKLDAL